MNKETLSQTLINLRKSAGYTQQLVADNLCIIRQTYSHYENGRITPSADILCRLADLYHIPSEYLINLLLPDEFQKKEKISDTDEYLYFFADSEKRNRYKGCTIIEKQLLFQLSKLDSLGQKQLIEIAKVLADTNSIS
ncbi:DNA-binding transcriptional regulator, XRE-family HTH domain [Lachnospiraceae bacterium]|nr:DNA-binding transcriptional regulator, XRE-family HTH domain [Lachnospiraceae bacterium]